MKVDLISDRRATDRLFERHHATDCQFLSGIGVHETPSSWSAFTQVTTRAFTAASTSARAMAPSTGRIRSRHPCTSSSMVASTHPCDLDDDRCRGHGRPEGRKQPAILLVSERKVVEDDVGALRKSARAVRHERAPALRQPHRSVADGDIETSVLQQATHGLLSRDVRFFDQDSGGTRAGWPRTRRRRLRGATTPHDVLLPVRRGCRRSSVAPLIRGRRPASVWIPSCTQRPIGESSGTGERTPDVPRGIVA